MTGRLAPTAATLRRLAAVAQCDQPADLVISGGALVDVFTEEVVEGWGLAVAAGRIAYAGPEADARAGPETRRIDLEGDLVAPGLIEGHTHLMRVGIAETARHQLRAGVTTMVAETMELGLVAGPAGVLEMLRAAAAAPQRVFLTISPLLGLDPDWERTIATPEEWSDLLDESGVVGVGEVFWADILRGHERAWALVDGALRRGLVVQGHGAGAKLGPLNAMAAAGIDDDHEGIHAADVLNRLRIGLRVLGRHGATRQDLPAIAGVWRDSPAALHRMSLVTDGVEPADLAAGDSLNSVVEMAVAEGLPLPAAIRMASHAAAEALNLGRWLGGTAPGMLADLIVLPRSGGLRPRLVLIEGEVPAEAGSHSYPPAMLDTVHPAAFDPALLRHPGKGRWRAMELVAPVVTRELETDGEGALPLCSIDRLGGARAFRGLLVGFGLEGGAVAVSSGWDTPGVTAVGDVPADLEISIRRLAELGGGAVVVSGGQVLAEWRAELGGIQSTAPLAQVVGELEAVNGALRSLGSSLPNPVLTVETLTTSAIPHLRIWPGGYLRLRDGSRPGLDW